MCVKKSNRRVMILLFISLILLLVFGFFGSQQLGSPPDKIFGEFVLFVEPAVDFSNYLADGPFRSKEKPILLMPSDEDLNKSLEEVDLPWDYSDWGSALP